MAAAGTGLTDRVDDEVVEICRDLIRIDSSNPTSNERAAAEWVAERLTDAGLSPEVLESEPGRASVVARWAGEDSSRTALLVHGHLDVVPADAGDWQVDPFAGEIRDDCIWGRGAVDMKDMDAMTLAVVGDWIRQGKRPPRDVVLTFLADEEAGGLKGARWLVENHADLFADCSEAISEVGGFSVTVAGRRLYAIETAEKGIAWLTLVARGRAGHGSMLNDDNAVTAVAEATARLGRHRFPVELTPSAEAFLRELCDALGVSFDPDDVDGVLAKLGPIARMVGATLRHTANPTMLNAGYKHNVIPQRAVAYIDCRFLPGGEERFHDELARVVGPDVAIEMVHTDIAYETTFDGDLVDAMKAALNAEDPDGRPVPYCLSGGTDAKHFARLGIRCFGFSPLRLPPDLDFTGMFHGIDERVPLDGLRFGARVLSRFLAMS
ncbi:MAG TPA: M20/M25/M40 family metallo-hydrolase [Mycobacteriales bacterium]|jgi:acetylornithine deacetylase/succinyl-diaminopimelate desuccinylase-like protein|nr:M20/M25/M40 family metallo-hydrolase [Mycobacteriales bacterium]